MTSKKGVPFDLGSAFQEHEVATLLAHSSHRRFERPESNKCTKLILALAISFGLSLLITFKIKSSYPVGPGTGSIDWKPCEEDETILCGFLECVYVSIPHAHLNHPALDLAYNTHFRVPTDYDDMTVGITTLAMTKIPAKVPSARRKGSLLVLYLVLF